jgi:hypothetical protein
MLRGDVRFNLHLAASGRAANMTPLTLLSPIFSAAADKMNGNFN